MSTVSVKKVDSYDRDTLYSAIDGHFKALGVEKDMRPDLKVLLKPNLLSAHSPEHAVTTNPAVLAAIMQWLWRRGVKDITIADSPGGPYVSASLKMIYNTCGLKPLDGMAKLNLNTAWQTVRCPDGCKNHSFNIIAPVCEADYIINVAKLKTHSMTTISAGIKNLFGTVPGLQKPELHYRHPEVADFSNMLIELAQTVAPAVTVIDAVDAMEGNGPNAGTPRHMGLILASRDMYAQDWYAASLMGIDPDTVPMLRIAKKKRLVSPENITVTGDADIGEITPFKLPDTKQLDFTSYVPPFLRTPAKAFLSRFLKPLPKVDKLLCLGCGKCAESCPSRVITIENGVATMTGSGCISCFCCQEMCPVHAVSVKRVLKF